MFKIELSEYPMKQRMKVKDNNIIIEVFVIYVFFFFISIDCIPSLFINLLSQMLNFHDFCSRNINYISKKFDITIGFKFINCKCNHLQYSKQKIFSNSFFEERGTSALFDKTFRNCWSSTVGNSVFCLVILLLLIQALLMSFIRQTSIISPLVNLFARTPTYV